MSRALLTAVFIAVTSTAVQAADLKTYKDVYDKNLEEIVLGHGPKLVELQQQYVKALEALKAKVQGDGELKKTKAVIAEIERFQKDKNIQSDSELPEIRKLQAVSAKQITDLELDKARRIVTLATQYDGALERLEKELTKAGKLDEATAIEEERNKVKNSDYLTAANRVTGIKQGKEGTAGSFDKPAKKAEPDLPKKALELDFGKNIKMKLVLIKPGKFLMGSPENLVGRQPNELPQREVTITKPFYMGVYEVRQDEYDAVLNNNPSEFKGDKLPVEKVSWDDAMAFCRQASEKTGKKVRLPTEAEWEYVCRAGTDTRFSFGDKSSLMCKHGNYCDRTFTGERPWRDEHNSDGFDKTAPVGSFKPNAWGLYDMHGNVWEWCLDNAPATYDGMGTVDPVGRNPDDMRVVRGGGYGGAADHLRSAARLRMAGGAKTSTGGFRVVVECN